MNKTVNLEMLNEIMDNDDELIRECFADYKSDYSESLAGIKEAIDGNDAESLHKRAHAFKGSLKYLAADTAADFALELEQMGRSEEIIQDEAKAIYSNLVTACEDLVKFIDNY